MTQTGYSSAIVNALLGWLKGLATWVLKLFNLAGSGGNPLLWLSQNWLKLLLLLLVAGVVLDWLVWMVRWRPYWVWFRKKRIIVNDERFLAEDEFADEDFEDDPLEQRYVVPSKVVKRRAAPTRVRARRPVQQIHAAERRVRKTQDAAMYDDDLFEVGRDQEDYSDFFEDEVFNLSNLPEAQDAKHGRKRRK